MAAIERVEVRGPEGREFAVVLTSNDPRPDAPGHSLVSRSAPAVREFAEALRRALPVRDAAEPRPDGASVVSVEPMERPGLEPRQVALAALGVGYALITVALVARGAGEQAVVCWLVGVPTVLAPGVAALVGPVRTTKVGRRTGWQLTGGMLVAVLPGLPMTPVGLGMAASAPAALRVWR